MKKRIGLFLVVALVIAAVSAPFVAAQAKYTIANVPKMVGIAWWDRMEVGNKQFSSETGHEVFQIGSHQLDPAEQVRAIEDVIAQGVDAINVIPVSPEALEPILGRAMNEGIVVIAHEAPNLQNVHYDVEAFENRAYGAHLMENLAQEMGGEGGYIIMVGALTMATHQEWAQGAIEYQEANYPNMYQVAPMVEMASEGGAQEASYVVAREVIATYPDIKGFIGMDMLNPPGIAMAVEEAGKSGQIAVTGTSLVSVARDYLENGTIKTISFWDPAIAGRAMCALAVKVIEGEEIVDGIDLGVPGFENCTVDGKLVIGSAWVDVNIDNMEDYNF